MHVQRFTDSPGSAVLSACREVYASAFAQEPYDEDDSQADAFIARLERYASERQGFALDVAMSEGQPRAFCLSVLARPGDWWREQVAASIGPEAAAAWLGASCREVVHVAVAPAAQHRGIGMALMQAVLAAADAATVVLSCHPDALGAQRLYVSLGFTVLTTKFRSEREGLDYWVMGMRTD